MAAAAAGDAVACEQLVEAFLPSIAGVASIYRSTPGVDRAELMQEGVVGLLKAARRYDPARGTPFWAYASWWVRQAMQQLVAEMTRPVALSDRPLRGLARIKEARAKHLQDHGREPSITELVTATGPARKQVESLIAIERTPRGLDEPVSGEEGATGTLQDLVEDPVAEDQYQHVLDRMEIEFVRGLTDGLSERERNILLLALRPGLPCADAGADRRTARGEHRAGSSDRGAGAEEASDGCRLGSSARRDVTRRGRGRRR